MPSSRKHRQFNDQVVRCVGIVLCFAFPTNLTLSRSFLFSIKNYYLIVVTKNHLRCASLFPKYWVSLPAQYLNLIVCRKHNDSCCNSKQIITTRRGKRALIAGPPPALNFKTPLLRIQLRKLHQQPKIPPPNTLNNNNKTPTKTKNNKKPSTPPQHQNICSHTFKSTDFTDPSEYKFGPTLVYLSISLSRDIPPSWHQGPHHFVWFE